MQVKIAATAPAPAFNLRALQAAFKHHADGSGVFESGQHPIIVGQAAYNSAYGTNFASSQLVQRARQLSHPVRRLRPDHDQGGDLFGFNTLLAPDQDGDPDRAQGDPRRDERVELRRVREDDGEPRPRGRPGHPGRQNVILYPFVNPPTELIDATNLPQERST